ncbi:TetR/AcrR family transcriptional regulator [Janibacter corallicola]|uniref:TetR/AcrR family transcriptional regulator n=1 Tax=Janibacter corallicola TaxID=415212 RepID=UPI0008346D9B|nr:TetR/AcrR family transcriptional regulator [Janibacter corallicola]
MSSADDRTARARIRDTALELFAEHGEGMVTMRQIAEQAGVSPALVVHHFGSKDGLRDAVVEHVRAWLDDLIDRSSQPDVTTDLAAGNWGSIAELVAPEALDGTLAAMPRYLRRLLLSGDPVGTDLIRSWHTRTVEVFKAWDAAGVIDAGENPRIRAAICMTADFGLFLLADQWREVLGTDPLGDGLPQWAAESMSVYGALFTGSTHPSAQE